MNRSSDQPTRIARRHFRRWLLSPVVLVLTAGANTVPPAGATAVAAPELPRHVPESSDPYPGRPCSITLGARDDITAALRKVRGSAVVCLTPGVTYEPFELPDRQADDSDWVVLRTDGPIPDPGTRVRPADAARFAKIVQNRNGAAAVTTSPRASRYMLQGLEIATGPEVNKTNALVALGRTGPDQDTMDEVPQHLILSHVYIHGSTTGGMQRCVYLNSGSTAIVDSWIAECHGKGYDSQAIGSINGPGPFLIRNNYLEGAGENVMFGGATPSIPNMVASDITFQRNHVYTPISWKGRWTKKNLFELKNAVRVLIEENVFDGSWTDGQIGAALLFKSINDQGNCNWCRTTDVTVRRSYITHAAGGIVFSGAETYSGGRVDTAARRFLIQDVVFDSLNVAPYTGGGRGIQITGGASDIVFERTVIAGNIRNAMVLDRGRPASRTTFRNSVWTHGAYFASADGPGVGLPSLRAGLPGFGWQGMTIVRRTALNPLPPGTAVVAREDAAPLARQIRSTVATAVRGVITR